MSSHTPLLLVSLARASETAAAIEGGADILDVKDPSAGALGAAPTGVLRAVAASRVAACHARVPPPLSAALGDAADPTADLALAAAAAAACGAEYVKIGLAGETREEAAASGLRRVVESLRGTAPFVRVIAAGFADAVSIGGLPPLLLPRVARRAGAHGCLIDTYRKDGRSLLDHLALEEIAAFVRHCRDAGLVAALAGSLRAEHLEPVRGCEPDVVGVRGAACIGGRNGRLDAERIRALAAALRGGHDAPAAPPTRAARRACPAPRPA